MTATHTPRKGRVRVGLILLMIGFVLICVMIGAGAALLPRDAQITTGVTIDGVNLGGMTESQAQQVLAERMAVLADQQVTFSAGDETRTVTLEKIGARPDVATAVKAAYVVGREGSVFTRVVEVGQARWNGRPLRLAYAVDEARIHDELHRLGREINHPPINASAHWNGQQVVLVPGHPGAKLDMPVSLKKVKETILDALARQQPVPATIELEYRTKYPQVTTEMLQGVDTVLGEFSTSFASSSRNRATNIEMASKYINHRVLLPGEVFSFNKTVGERTVEKGFREAPVIVNGEMDFGIGGGICQVSTTLYNAVLLANLPIVARNHHSIPSHYVKPGLDATVSYGSLDLQFRNAMETPIVIEAEAGNRRLLMRVLGKGPKPDVHIERTGLSRTGMGITTHKDPTLPKGKKVVEQKGRSGVKVTVIRVVGSGPDATRETLSTDRYPGETRIVRVGTGPAKATDKGKKTGKDKEKPAHAPARPTSRETGTPSQD